MPQEMGMKPLYPGRFSEPLYPLCVGCAGSHLTLATFVNTNGGRSEIEENRNLNSIPEEMVSRLGFEPRTPGLKVWM